MFIVIAIFWLAYYEMKCITQIMCMHITCTLHDCALHVHYMCVACALHLPVSSSSLTHSFTHICCCTQMSVNYIVNFLVLISKRLHLLPYSNTSQSENWASYCMALTTQVTTTDKCFTRSNSWIKVPPCWTAVRE